MYSPSALDDLIEMRGELVLELRDEFGNVKELRHEKNLVVTAGKTFIASRMAGASSTVMTHMAVGTTNTAAAAGDTTLAAEVGSSRTALTVSGGTPSTNVVTYACTFGAGVGTGALVEAGLFNASSSGTMLARTVFSTITKAAGDSLTITWTVTVG